MSEFYPSIMWYNNPQGQREYIAFPATMEEVIDSAATVSKYPVQQGFEIANHMIRHNRKINLSVIVPEVINGGIDAAGATGGSHIGGVVDSLFGTNLAGVTTVVGGVLADPKGTADKYISGVVDSLTPVVSGIAGAVDTAAGWFGVDTGLSATVDTYTQRDSRIQDTLDKLKFVQEEGLICSVSTVHDNYGTVVLTNFNLTTNSNTITAAEIQLEFEEIIVVDSLGNKITRITGTDPSQSMVEFVSKKASTDFNNPISDYVEAGLSSIFP